MQGTAAPQSTQIEKSARIQPDAVVGGNCRILDHVYVASGVILSDRVTVGMSAYVGLNVRVYAGTDIQAHAILLDSTEKHWTSVGRGAIIGANSTILAGVQIGQGARVLPGAVVGKDVPRSRLLQVTRPSSSVMRGPIMGLGATRSEFQKGPDL